MIFSLQQKRRFASFIRTCTALAVFQLFALNSVIHAQPFQPFMDNPEQAISFDYCAWQFDEGAPPADLEQTLAVLADSNSYAGHRAAAALIEAGVRIAQYAENKKTCSKTLERGLDSYDKLYKKRVRSIKKQAGFKPADDTSIQEVQKALSDLWLEDQTRRRLYIELRNTQDSTGAPYWAKSIAISRGKLIDLKSTAYLNKLLDEYDWIDIHRFGPRISNFAWLLVQHADEHPAFQKLALERMEPYLENGGIKKSNYAYLYDRVAVNHGKKQLYGTQPIWECTDNGLELAPLLDPETVNERRAALGMGTVEESLAQMSASSCGK